MDYPAAKRTRKGRRMAEKQLVGTRKKAKCSSDGSGGAGDHGLQLNGVTRANFEKGRSSGSKRTFQSKLSGERGKDGNEIEDEYEDAVEFVCELVPDGNVSSLRIGRGEFEGVEVRVNNKDMDILKFVETFKIASKGMSSGGKGANDNGNVGKKNVRHVDSEDSMELELSSDEEANGSIRGRKRVEYSNSGKINVGDLKERVGISDVHSEELGPSSDEEANGKIGGRKAVESSNSGKEKVGGLKGKVEINDAHSVDSEELGSSSSEEDNGKRWGQKRGENSNVEKKNVGNLKGKMKINDVHFVDSDDSEEFGLSSSEEDNGKGGGQKVVKNRNVQRKMVSDVQSVDSLDSISEDDKGRKGGQKGDRSGNVGEKRVRALKGKMKASEISSSDSDDSEDLISPSSEEDKEVSDDDFHIDDSSKFDETDSSDDLSAYPEDENLDEEIEEVKDDSDDDDVDEGRIRKENVVAGKANDNTVNEGKGKTVESRSNEKFKPHWVYPSKYRNDSTVWNNKNDEKKEEEGEGKTVEARSRGLKRRRFCGSDIVNDSKNENIGEPQNPHYFTKSGKEKLNVGKVSGFSSGSDGDNGENDDLTGNYVRKDAGGKLEGEFWQPATRRKRYRVGKDFDPIKILTDSIWEKGESLVEEFVDSKEKSPAKGKLVYKFSLADQDPKPPEKPDWEKENDDLFAIMQISLATEEIGSSSVVDKDETVCPTGSDPASCCSEGFHELILDEQIGIFCIYCSYVHQEIKYIVPTFVSQR